MALPKPSGDFEWVQASWGAALRCAPLAAIAPHCFSTRDSRSRRPRDETGWEALARALGVSYAGSSGCARCTVPVSTKPGVGNHRCAREWPEADIAVTRDPSLVFTVRTADCVPILLADPRTGAVAAVHAGWKGTAAGAVMAAVQALESEVRQEPPDMVAAVGPSIGPCCYEVGDELRRISPHIPTRRWFSSRHEATSGSMACDTRSARTRRRAANRSICAELCTCDHPALFHSYRRDGARAGRLVAAIRSAPGTML